MKKPHPLLLILLILILLILLIIGIGLLFLNFYPSVGKAPDKEAQRSYEGKNAIFRDGAFENSKQFSLMSGEAYPRSPRVKPERMIKAETPELINSPEAEDLSFTWLGHSSFLLQMGGKNILVDPVLGKRSSPVSFAGPERFSEAPLTPEEMPEIDILLLSHDHYDHLDYGTIRKLIPKTEKFLVPLGVDSILRGWGVEEEKIIALDWWESTGISGITLTLTPSQHFTGRNPFKRNVTLWGGFYLDNGIHKVYYTGDGGYCDVFGMVKEKLGSPELMISECGQYDPSWASVHMFPEEVIKAYFDTGAEWLIPVHWGTFCICNHAWDDSIRRVSAEAEDKGASIATPRIGQTVTPGHIGSYHEAWWEAYE